MFYKVSAVKPLSEYRLWVQFLNGEQKEYDVKPLFEKWAAFRALSRVSGLFEQVRVDAGGYGISWNDDIDLSCDELYNAAKRTPPMKMAGDRRRPFDRLKQRAPTAAT